MAQACRSGALLPAMLSSFVCQGGDFIFENGSGGEVGEFCIESHALLDLPFRAYGAALSKMKKLGCSKNLLIAG
jgi:cyclophilin family peptidyl-prolyl cis-trans isomerase